MENTAILFRAGNLEQEQELEIASKYFPVYRLRSRLPYNSLVIGRFSTLPYYAELELDLATVGSQLINSYTQHRWVSNFDYYEDVKDYTPRSWDEREFYKSGYDGPLVIKGRTNSRKQRWGIGGMYAEDRKAAYDVASELANDPLIGPQGIIYREYVPLVSYETCPISGMPFANEWRLFYFGETLLSCGYYWTIASDETVQKAKLDKAGLDLAGKISRIAAKHVNLFVLDIAETQDGRWILIEINDGTCAGVGESQVEQLYRNLSYTIRR